jgi:hypothetical protein
MLRSNVRAGPFAKRTRQVGLSGCLSSCVECSLVYARRGIRPYWPGWL